MRKRRTATSKGAMEADFLLLSFEGQTRFNSSFYLFSSRRAFPTEKEESKINEYSGAPEYRQPAGWFDEKNRAVTNRRER